ncbi:MAG: hypothetical protein GY804_02780 [Alphaproteobacteria bacterium]|nr:hypothetical protein [Alphaproteobacteria bacterium]
MTIGCLMLSDCFDRVAEVISFNDFADQKLARCFVAIGELHKLEVSVDIITISDHFENKGIDIDIAYLGQIAKDTPSAVNAIQYAKKVKEFSIRRQVIAVSNQMRELSINPDGLSPENMLSECEGLIKSLVSKTNTIDSHRDISEVMSNFFDKMDAAVRCTDEFVGVSSGLKSIDDHFRGFEPGLITIGGRSGMGKTTLGLQLFTNMCIDERNKKPSVYFTREMPAEQLMLKQTSMLGSINSRTIKSGDLDDGDWARLTNATSLITNSKSKIIIYDSNWKTLDHVLNAIKKSWRKSQGLTAVFIDYVQMISVPGKNSKREEITLATEELKKLSTDLKVPIFILAQMNRDAEKRTDKSPLMSDLKESGSIEQDSDIIMFPYRDEVYDPESKDKGICKLIVAKNREGETGSIALKSELQFSRFSELEFK